MALGAAKRFVEASAEVVGAHLTWRLAHMPDLIELAERLPIAALSILERHLGSEPVRAIPPLKASKKVSPRKELVQVRAHSASLSWLAVG